MRPRAPGKATVLCGVANWRCGGTRYDCDGHGIGNGRGTTDRTPEADAERISRTAEFSEGLTQLLTHSTINALASMHMSQLLSDEPAVVFKL